ncbi:MAG: GntR family transcriptional regulator [Pusillimonas sp.]
MSQIKKNSEVALYLQIADILSADIQMKNLLPSERLPSEQDLMRKFGVSRVTVRQAVRTVVERGLALSKQGKGVFVTGPQLRQELHELKGFYDSLLAQGYHPETRLLDFNVRLRTELEQDLGVEDRYVYCFKRIYEIEHTVIAIADARLYSPDDSITRAQAETLPVYSLITDVQKRLVARAGTQIRSIRVQAPIDELMGLEQDSYVLEMLRTSRDDNGKTLETTRFHIQPDGFAFHLDVAGPLQIAPSLGPSHNSRQQDQPIGA